MLISQVAVEVAMVVLVEAAAVAAQVVVTVLMVGHIAHTHLVVQVVN